MKAVYDLEEEVIFRGITSKRIRHVAERRFLAIDSFYQIELGSIGLFGLQLSHQVEKFEIVGGDE